MAVASLVLLAACSTDDSYDEPQALISSEGTAVSFGSYLGRATTRGAAYLEPSEIALNGGIGVYAMYTQGKEYNPINELAETKYSDNFMENIQLGSSLTEEELQTTDADVASNWVYAPVRYWPNSVFDYLSFMAYAPYDENKKQLYDKDGNTTGDLSYIQHTVAEDPRNQIDLLYADPTGITNMQLYRDEDSKWKWANGNTFSESADDATPPKVELNFKHATSRIGFVVTSSALKSPLNFSEEDKAAALVAKSEDDGSGLYVEVWAYPVNSSTNITVNKVMFLGDNSSAESSSPTGAFTKTAYLNLSNVEQDTKPLWNGQNGKLAFTYDNTRERVRVVHGNYIENGTSYSWKEGSESGETGKYIWEPSEKESVEQLFNWGGNILESWEETEKWWINYLTFQAQELDPTDYGYKDLNEMVSDQWNKYYKDYIQEQWKEKTDKRKIVYGVLSPNDSEEGVWEDEAEIYPVGNNSDDYMFIIPQDFTDGSDNELWVYLDYTVNYVGNSGEAEHVNYKVYRQLKQKFEAGKAYIVVMDIGKKDESTTTSSFNSVNFTVQLDQWADEVNTDNIKY